MTARLVRSGVMTLRQAVREDELARATPYRGHVAAPVPRRPIYVPPMREDRSVVDDQRASQEAAWRAGVWLGLVVSAWFLFVLLAAAVSP